MAPQRVWRAVRRCPGGENCSLSETSERLYGEVFDIDTAGALLHDSQVQFPYLNDGASIILNASVAVKKGLPGASIGGQRCLYGRSRRRQRLNQLSGGQGEGRQPRPDSDADL